MSVFRSKQAPFQRLLPLWEGRFILIATGLLLTFLCCLLLIFPPVFLRQSELRLYDFMHNHHSFVPEHDVPVLVGIDEKSLHVYGQWPWPRYRIARLVERIRELGADVITLDFLMAEQDRTSPDVILAERQREIGSPFSSHAATVPKDVNSEQLSDAIAGGRTVIGFFFDFSGEEKRDTGGEPAVPEGLVIVDETGRNEDLPRPAGTIRSIPLLVAAAAEGFTNAYHDSDGVLRKTPILIPFKEKYYPSLALSSMLMASADRSIRIRHESMETILIWDNRRIPLDRHGNLLLNFRNSQKPFRYISAHDILARDLEAGSLVGKIVIIGACANGLGDLHLLPSGRSVNGIEVHATIIDTILNKKYISSPGWAKGAELLGVIFLGLVSTFFLSRPGFMLSVAAVAAGIGGSYWTGSELLHHWGTYISPLVPMLTPVLIITVLSILKYGIEAHKVKERNKNLIDAQDAIIVSMSALSAARDKETGGHILRTQHYVEVLADELARFPHYRYLDRQRIELLAKSAPLHDIGKVGIPDTILNKPGPLTEDEFAFMKTHTLIGAHALSTTIAGTERGSLDFLSYARQMIESHHERWDGSGYPRGLKGLEIPLAGRLMALADTYDAIVSSRIYKRDTPHEEAKTIIINASGKQFDPDVVAAFLAREMDFMSIVKKFKDHEEPTRHSESAQENRKREQR